MKRTLILVVGLLCAGLAGFLLFRSFNPSSKPAATAEKQLYTCGMHPQVVRDKPGDCPICGMKLQPLRKQPSPASGQASGERKIRYYQSTMTPGEVSQTPAKDSMGMDMVPVYEGEKSEGGTIDIDPVTIQTMGVRIGEVTSGPLKRSIRTVGVVDFNETALTDVTARFKGWIEKLFVDATGFAVKKGEPLFEAYSPEVYNTELEFASLTRSGNTALAKTSIERLGLLDVPAAELAQLKSGGKPSRTITMLSPADGVVIEKTAVAGMMFEPGMNLYRLADLSLVWLKAQIYEQDMAFVQLGQEAAAHIDSLPGKRFYGRVTYVYPTLDPKTRTAQVRMEFHNPGLLLKPGMFAKVELESEIAPSATLVPESAVLRSGDRATVFLALDGGKFDPREVILGPRDSSERYQVLHGLAPGDRVVTSAQFMLDSESQLREAIQKMLDPERKSAPVPADGHARMAAVPEAPATDAPKTFICPMPEHANIEYEHGGKCPVCAMTLIPGRASAQPVATPAPSATDHAPGNH
ncbi:MAG: efflux RND transporter periplasmic adaptor subunit [Terrimicrobiaceae bacterium]|nr:efflux RND transporter periplasmic adaptor subunit [Terrimicrobiaceae bacterium]